MQLSWAEDIARVGWIRSENNAAQSEDKAYVLALRHVTSPCRGPFGTFAERKSFRAKLGCSWAEVAILFPVPIAFPGI